MWPEYARGEQDQAGGEGNKFVGAKMFLVKFGPGPQDPIWPVDVFEPQVRDAPVIIGSLLADAINGFPVPYYPRCLQKAHENAALVDFDYDVMQNEIHKGILRALGAEAPTLDDRQIRVVDFPRLQFIHASGSLA